MSIASELSALNGYILSAYDEVNGKGGTVPANKNMANLASAIGSISGGGGGGLGIPLGVNQNGVLTRSADSFTFTSPAEATRIQFDTSTNVYGLIAAFYHCRGLTALDLSSITMIIGSDVMRECFYGCTNLVSVDFSNLDTINGSGAMTNTFASCSSLSSVDFSSLRRVISSRAMYRAFEYCSSLSSLSFPSFDASVSANSAFNDMLYHTSGCTVHFPASQESTMSSWSYVTNGFGGTNTTVLFDL